MAVRPAYIPITDAEIDADLSPPKPITVSLLARLRDNGLAIIQGDPTAPKILNAAFADNTILTNKITNFTVDAGAKLVGGAITAAKIDTNEIPFNAFAVTTVSKSQTNTGGAVKQTIFNDANFTRRFGYWIPDPDFGSTVPLLPIWSFDWGSGLWDNTPVAGNLVAGAELSYMWLWDNSQQSGLLNEVSVFCIASSPPYNLGNGELPLFLSVLLNADDSISAMSVAPDPHWDKPRGRLIMKNGETWLRECAVKQPEKGATKKDIEAYLENLRNPDKWILRPITMADKLARMNESPHTFSSIQPGQKAIMISQPSDLLWELAEKHSKGFSVHQIVKQNGLKFSPVNIDRSKITFPEGVIPAQVA